MNKPQLLLILSLLATSGPRLPAATEQVHVLAGLVAVVNDRLILGSDIRERMYSTTETLRRQYRNDPALFEQKLQAQRRNVLEDLINDELILAEAIAAGRQVPEKHLGQYMAGLIQTNYYGDSNLLLQTLAAQGTTVEVFRERHRQNDLVGAARRGRTDNIEPPMPEQIEEYYRAHEQDFRVEESVKLGMIVLNKNPTNSLAAVESQRKLAAEIRALLAEGRDFATVAQTYSQGGRAQQGGDWGWVERSVLRQELAVVAFSLKPGELSDVIETKEAWYLMRVADHRPAALKPLAEVRAEIWKALQEQDRAAVLKRWLDGLRADAFVRYYGGGSVESASSPNRVFKIEIKHVGVATVSDALIRSHLRVKEGELVTQANVDHDIRSLYGTGDFYDIRVTEETLDGESNLIRGSKLFYVVQEKPMLDVIQFAGNQHISRQELLPKLTSKTGERLDERKLFNDARAIQNRYQKSGYPQATVKSVPSINEQNGHGSVTFEVTEGLTTPAADSIAPTNRLTVAMLAFADKTGEPESAHWRYSLPRMVASPLGAVKAIRIYPAEASDYGLRRLKLKAGEPIDATQARKIGELIEARRVVWGDYRRQGKTWTATAQVLNVASGKPSVEFSATDADWFEVCDQLAEKILQELALKPTEAERARMKIRFTTSSAAFEIYSQFYALQTERKPYAELERCARQALAADPRCAEMHLALASCWFNQGKLEEGTQEINEALKLKPESDTAHMALGAAMLFQDKPEVAAKEFREAIRLDPDEPESHIRLAEYLAAQGEWMQAVSSLQAAQQLNPVSADVRAHLGLVYADQGERTKALHELEAAEFFGLDDVNAEQMTSRAYDDLHEIPLAVEHYEKFLALARGQGANPKMVQVIAERMQKLKATLTPVFVNSAEPKAYSEQSLRAALRVRLSAEELALVNFPLTSTPDMKRWAEELTQGATNDFQKAQSLYQALIRHLDAGPGGSRTAQETYADWQKPLASFRCQEYARLYVALARDVRLKASFVSVDRDYEDKTVLHACAGILLEGKALLADPSYQWFGVPHKNFEFLDDYQAIVGQLHQSHDLLRLRLAVKLQPDSALSQFNLALELMNLDQWNEARLVLQTALRLDSESWFAHGTQGILARHEGQPELAVTHLRKAVELYPLDADIHHTLAHALWDQGQLKEAREEFRTCLKYWPESFQAAEVRHAIAEINEKLGTE